MINFIPVAYYEIINYIYSLKNLYFFIDLLVHFNSAYHLKANIGQKLCFVLTPITPNLT